MDILCLGQQGWDHCWTGKQQLMTRLAERGHRILYLDPGYASHDDARTIRTASWPGHPGLRHRGPGDLWTYTFLPFRRPAGQRVSGNGAPGAVTDAVPVHSSQRSRVKAELRRIRRERTLRAVLRTLGFHAPVALCLHPDQRHALRPAHPQALVYYAVDEYTAYGNMPEESRRRIRAAEEEVLAEADVALGVSAGLRDRFAATCPASYVLENGSDVEHYRPEKLERIASHPRVDGLEGRLVGFIGQVDSRIDQGLLAEIAERRPDWTLVLAGRRTVDVAPLESRPNIRFLDYQPYEALPSIAKRVEAWMVPYVENELTHACNPLKVYEYLATGRPVVSRPLNGLVVCRDVISLARGTDEFIAALDAALADPEAGRSERVDRAEANDWYARADELEARMHEAVRRAKQSGRWLRAVTPLPPARFFSQALCARPDRVTFSRKHAVLKARVFGARAAGVFLRGSRPASRPQRILVAWRGFLGDFIALQPMLAHLRRQFPEATINLGVNPGSSGPALFSRSQDVDDVIPLGVEQGPRLLSMRLRRALRLIYGRYDVVVAGGNEHFMLDALLVGARRHVSFYEGWRQNFAGNALRRDRSVHEVENDIALAEVISGQVAEEEVRRPQLHLDEVEVAQKRRALLDALSIGERDTVLVVHPGSKRASRRWPADRLGETITRVLDGVPDLVVVLTGTEGERSLAEELMAHLPERVRARVRDASGRTDIAGLAGLLDRADTALACDTGVMHFARARGTPLVALLGPENHRLWGPYAEGDAPAWAIRREVPCAPCRLDRCAPHFCMRSIAVDDVERAVLRKLGLGRDKRPEAGTLDLDFERRSWSGLARGGFDLPLVSVIVDATHDPDALAATLPVIERQTYPRIEVVHVVPRGAARRDDRDAERRRGLPIVVHEADGAEAGCPAARGELLVRATPGIDWRASRLALDVAAATRTPEGDDVGFFDGLPLDVQDQRHDALVRRTVNARAPAHQDPGGATPVGDQPRSGVLSLGVTQGAD